MCLLPAVEKQKPIDLWRGAQAYDTVVPLAVISQSPCLPMSDAVHSGDPGWELCHTSTPGLLNLLPFQLSRHSGEKEG